MEILRGRGDRAEADRLEAALVAMMLAEAGGKTPRSVAIVDENPESQFFFPEMGLWARLLGARWGADARVVAPETLRVEGDALVFADGVQVDMVYLRLCDWELEHAEAIRSAWTRGLATVTPHPSAHARLADKARLVEWSRAFPDLVPETTLVKQGDVDALWAGRKDKFFKPRHGFGGRGTFKGKTMQRKVAQELVKHEYVAQRAVAPPKLPDSGLKYDIRAFAYAGRVQAIVARLYAGQVTNMQTEGGGLCLVKVDKLQPI